jgi:hypothetical protein
MGSTTLARGGAALHPGPSLTAAPAARGLLLLGAVLALLGGAALGDPRPLIAADPDLARLLRGMALIKAAMVLAALALLWWRFGHPLPARHRTAYLLGAWLACAATALIWQLSHVVPAALVFHGGELLLLFTAWRDGQRPV